MSGIFAAINSVQTFLVLGLVLVVVGMSLYALIHTLTTPAQAFPTEGKRTRNFWALLNLLALVISFLGITPNGYVGLFGVMMALIIPAVYLADVRPAVSSWRRRGNNSRGMGQRPPTPW